MEGDLDMTVQEYECDEKGSLLIKWGKRVARLFAKYGGLRRVGGG